MSSSVKKFTPTKDALNAAISKILDKAVNADSPNAPYVMYMIISNEHPEWKLRERRVAKYMKRQLKSRTNDPVALKMAAQMVDVDEDEESVYSTLSVETARSVVPPTGANSNNTTNDMPVVSPTSMVITTTNNNTGTNSNSTNAAKARSTMLVMEDPQLNTWLHRFPKICDGMTCTIM